MEPECMFDDDTSTFSSSDEFGWKAIGVNNEKECMFMNDIKMALSGTSYAYSSESGDDSESDSIDMQGTMVCDDSDSRQKKGVAETNVVKNESVLSRLASNTVSDSDSDELRSRIPLSKDTELSSAYIYPCGSFNLAVPGDSAAIPKHSQNPEYPKNKIQSNCIISTSSGLPLQPEEVAGVDVKQFAVDSSEPALCCEDLTADEEVWLVQCPNNVDPEILKTQLLLSPDTSKISAGQGQMLEVSSHGYCPEALTFVLPSRVDQTYRLVILKPAGQIVIREHVDIPQPAVFKLKKNNVTFPVGLKLRHPLLGADYEKELANYHESARRLRSYCKRKKKRKRSAEVVENHGNNETDEKLNKRKKRKLLSLNFSGMSLKTESLESIHNPSSPKSKKKKSTDIESPQLKENIEESNAVLNESYSSTKKQKKKEKKRRKDEIFESDKNVECGEKSKKHKKRKLFAYTTYEETLSFGGMPIKSENYESIHDPVSPKSKNISSNSERLQSPQLEKSTKESNAVLNESCSNSKKKKKHKRNSEVENSPLIPENIGQLRKRKHKEIETSFESSAEFTEREDGTGSKKKKKRKLESIVDTDKIGLVNNLLVSEENIQPIPQSDICNSLVATDRDSTDVTEFRENSATESLADFTRVEKRKKRKEKKRNSDEVAANANHNVIGISVNVEAKKEKDRCYRFTFPAADGVKNKTTSRKHKLSLNVTL